MGKDLIADPRSIFSMIGKRIANPFLKDRGSDDFQADQIPNSLFLTCKYIYKIDFRNLNFISLLNINLELYKLFVIIYSLLLLLVYNAPLGA